MLRKPTIMVRTTVAATPASRIFGWSVQEAVERQLGHRFRVKDAGELVDDVVVMHLGAVVDLSDHAGEQLTVSGGGQPDRAAPVARQPLDGQVQGIIAIKQATAALRRLTGSLAP